MEEFLADVLEWLFIVFEPFTQSESEIIYYDRAAEKAALAKKAEEEIYIWTACIFTLIALFLSVVYAMKSRMRLPVVAIPEVETNKKYRFRKRDKMQFYARKVLRKGRDTASKLQRQVSLIKEGVSVPEYSRSGRRLHKRERMMILAKQMFSGKKLPLLKKKELPSVVLEADIADEGAPNLPHEVLYLLQSVKVFGHFEKGVFLQLCRHMETVHLDAGDTLFEIGEDDKWLYVVQEGQINLYIMQDSAEVKLSEITAGESLHSLLSILDVLTGHLAPYKTVFARAIRKSVVLRLPAEAFSEAFKNRKESLVQIVQVIMTRLQRVTFLALHNYLGLTQELLKPTKDDTDSWLKIRQRSSSAILSDLADKHNLSHRDLVKQLTFGDVGDDELSFMLGGERLDISKQKPTESSRSLSTPTGSRKVKQLRFTEVDTVVDDDDNVFQRQSSFPIVPESRSQFQETIKQAMATPSASVESLGKESDGTSVSVGSLAQQQIYPLDEPQVLELVKNDLSRIFGINNTSILHDHIRLLKVCEGYKLISEGDQDVSLHFVVTGSLKVTQTLPKADYEEQREVHLFTATPGMITGQLAVLTGEPSFFGVRAVSDSVIARIARHSFYAMMCDYPHMVLNTAHTVMVRVSPFVRQIDFALDWIMVDAGKPVYRQGTYSDCMYIVLHGRLRAVHTKPDGKKELVSEFGKGEIVGMNEALKGAPRPTSLHAVRDTELAKIPEGLVKHIRRRHPGVVTRLITLMSDKLIGSMMSQKKHFQRKTTDFLTHKHIIPEETSFAYGDVSNHLANLSTVAILPASEHVPLDKFSMELHHALTHVCGQAVLRLDSNLIKQRLGHNALDSVHEYRLSSWLAHHEDMNRMVLYQTDADMTPWTERCIRQADAVLIVANGDSEPAVGDLESQLEGMAVRALKMLVLLHRPGIVHPTRTVEWLNMRGWLTDHIHIKGPKRLFARTRKSRLNEYWEKITSKTVDRFNDFSRLARFLTGTSVALVLGGGGARGLSHVGIIQSLLDAGIPIDMVGGTSIGAYVGGLWAAHRDVETMREKLLILCDDMSSIFSKLFDLTYPFTSMFSGRTFNNAIKQTFEDTQIEDLWIPYFNITTDITSSDMRVHTDGTLWRYVRGSMTYHPYLPPICDDKDGHLLLDGCFVNNLPGWLWRYVRSSMSLSGYLPPLCDPKDGHLLMDGGYINNLPGDVARSRGACKVIAIDVGSEDEADFTNYGDHLSGWWLLWKRLTGRWTGRVKVPDLNDIQSRLSYISCHFLLEKVIQSDYCYYVRPPIAKYKTLEFHKHVELFNVGLKHGQKIFTDEWTVKFWKDLLHDHSVLGPQTTPVKDRADISFTDLSEFVTQLDSKPDPRYMSDSENEWEWGYESSPEMFFTASNSLNRNQSEPFDMYKMRSSGTVSLSDVEAPFERSSFTNYLFKSGVSNGGDSLGNLTAYSSDEDDEAENSMLSSSL